MEQTRPIIGIDNEYGRYVDNIDINLPVLCDHLTKKGLNDEQINETIIHFSSDRVERFGKAVLGRCYYEGNLIQLYSLAGLERLHTFFSQNYSIAKCNIYAQREIGKVLTHELEHRIIHAQPLSDEMKTYNDRVSRLYNDAFTDDEKEAAEKWAYDNNPEEIRCNAAESEAPAGLVIVKLKSAWDTHPIGI